MSDKQYNVESLKGTVVIAQPGATGTVSLDNISGLTQTIVFTTDNMQDSDSTNFQIVNSSDVAFMSSGTVAESATTVLGTAVALISGDKLVATAEGTQSADRDIVYDIRYLR